MCPVGGLFNQPAPLGSFALFDSSLHSGKPTSAELGLEANTIVYASELWSGAPDEEPYQPAVEAAGERVAALGLAKNAPCQLDIEKWVLDTRTKTEAEVTAALDKIVQIVGWFRAKAPNVNVGMYALAPLRDYWTPVTGDATEIAAWKAANDYLAPLVEAVDTLYPSLYTFYDNQSGWVKYAKANIAEAKRIGGSKRILPFIWPKYHPSGPLEGTFVSGEYWTLQLKTIREAGCPGVIIWGHPDDAWDADAEWWAATQAFLA